MWKNGACTKPNNRPAVLRIAPGALTSVHPIYQILGPIAHRRRFRPLGTVSIDPAIRYWLVPSGRSRPGEPDRSLGKRVLPAILQAVTPLKREQHVDGSREGRVAKRMSRSQFRPVCARPQPGSGSSEADVFPGRSLRALLHARKSCPRLLRGHNEAP